MIVNESDSDEKEEEEGEEEEGEEGEQEEREQVNNDYNNNNSNDNNNNNNNTLAPQARENVKKILKKPSRFNYMKIGKKLNVDEVNAIGQHKNNLYLYVFVARCIAFSSRKEDKEDEDDRDTPQVAALTMPHFDMIRCNFHNYLRNGSDQIMGEHYFALNRTVFDRVVNSKHVERAVQLQSMSFDDFVKIYQQYVKQFIGRDNTRTCLTEWMMAFDLLCKRKDMKLQLEPLQLYTHEGLYNLFQQILLIRKDEATTIFTACRLDNEDEQLATFKRELKSQMEKLEKIEEKDLPVFIRNDMAKLYVKKSIERIYTVSGDKVSAALSRMQIKNKHSTDFRSMQALDSTLDSIQHIKRILNVDSSNKMFNKLFGRKKYTVTVTVHEAEGIELHNNAQLFVLMEVTGSSEMFRTDTVSAGNTTLDTEAKWIVAYPVTHFKLVLVQVNKKRFLLSNEKPVAKCDIEIYAGLKIKNKWFEMTCTNHKTSLSVKIKVSFSMDAPAAIKRSGFLFCESHIRWSKWRRRFFMIVQILEYKMILCTYEEKTYSPSHMVELEGYTVDFCDESEKKSTGAKRMFFFKLCKSSDSLLFASETETEQLSWIQKLHMATGQAMKPAGIDDWYFSSTSDATLLKRRQDMEHAFRQGLTDIVEADPTAYDQEFMFSLLQEQTLRYRLKEPYTSQGWFSMSQKFVLDEYCARYNISPIYRELDQLKHLTRLAVEDDVCISAGLITKLYELLALEVSGQGRNLPFTKKQYDEFLVTRARLQPYVEKQLIHFREKFPFGKPEYAMMEHIHLLQRIFISGDFVETNVDDFNHALDTCVQKAALVTYTEISQPIEEFENTNDGAEHVTRLCSAVDECVEVITEVKRFFVKLPKHFITDYSKNILILLVFDIEEYLKREGKDIQCNSNWSSLEIFRRCQQHCDKIQTLKNSDFQRNLLILFSPVVVRYCDVRESEISKRLEEMYKGHGHRHSTAKRCALHNEAATYLNQSVGDTQAFINSIGWPDELFLTHINHRLKMFAADIYSRFLNRLSSDFNTWLHKPKLNFRYLIPLECVRIMDTICGISEQVEQMKLYENDAEQFNDNIERVYHQDLRDVIKKTNQDTMCLVSEQFTCVLSKLLWRLSILDYADILVRIASKFQQSEDFVKQYYNFSTRNIEEVRQYMTHHETYLQALEKEIWKNVCNTIHTWIEKRSKPTMYTLQFNVVNDVVKSLKDLMSDLPEEDVDVDAYRKVQLQLDVHRFWES